MKCSSATKNAKRSPKGTNTSHELATHIRPVFTLLIPEAFKQGLKVAITTFSSQPDMIRAALAHAIPKDVVDAIVIRGEDGSWTCPEGISDTNGKLPHMASAGLAMGVMTAGEGLVVQMRGNRLVLVDDDSDNYDNAREHGVSAVLFQCNLGGTGGEMEMINDMRSME